MNKIDGALIMLLYMNFYYCQRMLSYSFDIGFQDSVYETKMDIVNFFAVASFV